MLPGGRQQLAHGRGLWTGLQRPGGEDETPSPLAVPQPDCEEQNCRRRAPLRAPVSFSLSGAPCLIRRRGEILASFERCWPGGATGRGAEPSM